MAFVILGSILIGLFIAWIVTKPYRSGLRHIPGPRCHPLIGSMLSINVEKYHENLLDFYKRYGPVVRVAFPHEEVIALSGYEEIKQVSISSGMAFGGRPTTFRLDYIFRRTGILLSPPDATWKRLRSICQKHFKQFGDGMSRIEQVAASNGSSMFELFRSYRLQAFDPHDHIFDAALMNIGFLVTGVDLELGDPFIDKMRELEWCVQEYIAPASKLQYMIYDVMPFLQHFRWSSWCKIENLCDLVESVWSDVKEYYKKFPEAASLAKVLVAQIDDKNDNTSVGKHLDSVCENDAKMTIISLLFAGAATTSATFYAGVNILAHKQNIQEKLFEEMCMICENGRAVTLGDKNKMPYTRAFLLEILRYVTTATLALPHVSLIDNHVNDIFVPQNTVIHMNLWGLHNDPAFWKNPSNFDPKRFLDEEGDLVPADHPNRQHLMPFGAGPRVCVGESMALARLFMWISMLIQQFKVVPAEDNPPENIQTDKFILQGVTRVPRYKVKFLPRDEI